MLFLSYKQRTILPISQRPNFAKFEHNTSTGVAVNPVGTKFRKFLRKGWFFDKTTRKWFFFQRLATSGRHNSAMIIDRRKFITKWSLYGKTNFHFYRWNQFIVIPLACTLRTRNLPNFLRRRTTVDGTARRINLILVTLSPTQWRTDDRLNLGF